MFADPRHLTTLSDILDAAQNYLEQCDAQANPQWAITIEHAKRAMFAADMHAEAAEVFIKWSKRIEAMSTLPPTGESSN